MSDQTIMELLYSQWTIRGPALDPEGSGAFLIEIAELPGFLVAAETKDAAIHELTPALRVHLQAYIESGKRVPQPRGSAGWKPFSEDAPVLVATPAMSGVRLQPFVAA